jgi:signal transduction histidine kinase
VTEAGPADLRRRVKRLKRQLDDRHVDDPVVQAALAELAAVAQRLVVDIGQIRGDRAALEEGRRELAIERTHSRALVDAAPIACLVTDADGIIRHANPTAVKLFGGRDLVGRPLVLRVARVDRARVHATATTCGHRGEALPPISVTLDGAGPALVRVELRCAPADAGRLLWVAHDVTEQETTHARLQEAVEREREIAEQLRGLDDVRNAFVLAVSHDLQAPVAGIAGLAELLVEQPKIAAADRRRMLEQIRSTSERLLAELHGLLDLQRLQEGDIGLERRPVDATSFLETAVATIDFGDRQVVVDTERVTAWLDPVITRRITDNLLNNAARHTPPGTTIWVRFRREPDGMLLVVEDDGPGVPERIRPRLFELFARDPHAAEGGLGVGLALVRSFAELHGGSARVESRPGGGASFHVLLPDTHTPPD